MRISRPFLALILGLLLPCISSLATESAPADQSVSPKKKKELRKEFEASVCDAGAFGASLPEKVLVYVEPAEKEALNAALRQIKPHTNAHFVAFPADQTAPQVIERKFWKRKLTRASARSEATLLVLLNASGEVVNLFVSEAKPQTYGVDLAIAVAKWKYHPAKINNTPVPTLICVAIGVDHETDTTTGSGLPY